MLLIASGQTKSASKLLVRPGPPPPFGKKNSYLSHLRGTSFLHLNEATRIIDGSNDLIVDFLFALVLILDSTHPWPLKNPNV